MAADRINNGFIDGFFIQQDNWQAYVNFNNNEESDEFLGYMDATRGFVSKLDSALKENNPDNFRQIIEHLVSNRRDLLTHAETLINEGFVNKKQYIEPK